MTIQNPFFKSYLKFPDGDNRAFNQVRALLSLGPCVTTPVMP